MQFELGRRGLLRESGHVRGDVLGRAGGEFEQSEGGGEYCDWFVSDIFSDDLLLL